MVGVGTGPLEEAVLDAAGLVSPSVRGFLTVLTGPVALYALLADLWVRGSSFDLPSLIRTGQPLLVLVKMYDSSLVLTLTPNIIWSPWQRGVAMLLANRTWLR